MALSGAVAGGSKIDVEESDTTEEKKPCCSKNKAIPAHAEPEQAPASSSSLIGKLINFFNEGAQTVSDTTIATGTQVQDALFRALHKKPEASRTTLANDGQPEPQQAAKQRAKP